MKNFSCSFDRIYSSGGFYESSETAQRLLDIANECCWKANLYPAFGYDRPPPAVLLSQNPSFSTGLLNQCEEWNRSYPRGASSDLFEIENGLLFNRCIYKVVDDEVVQMYETNKPNDRVWRPDLDPARDLQEIKQPRDAGKDYFYLGSIGSENYGHWLIDDLTRARSLLAHFSPDHTPVVLLNSYHPIIDAVREQSLRSLTFNIADIEVIFLNYRSAHFFPRLLVVSPSSYHPFLKSPAGLAFLREHFIEQAAQMHGVNDDRDSSQGGNRLFVTRRALWRNVINLESIIAYFDDLSFDIVELDNLTFNEQVRQFARADVIVGVMGAGMANVVFSPPGATVVHLAPEGWKDPFFWDLAAVKNHRYAVVFGQPWRPDSPSFSSFVIETAMLDTIRDLF